MKLDSRHILILLSLSLALSSCVQFSAQEGMAQLYPPVFEVDATVEDLAQTKAAPDAPVPDAPALSDIHFTVKDKDGNPVYDNLGVWDTPLKLPVGAYSIEAYSGSNTFGTAYFTGTASGTVAGGQEETPQITMALKNAYLAVGLTDNLAKHFKTSGNCIRISTESASIDTGLDTYVFVPSGQQLSIAISGTSSTGVPKTITHSLAACTAATATYLSCDMTTTNAPAITLSGTTEAWGSVGYLTVSNISFDNISTDNQSMIQYNAYEVKTGAKTTGAINGSEITFTGLTPGETYNVYAEIGALKSGAVSMSVVKPEITISESAHHTLNASSELDGTDFTASINIPEKFKSITTAALTLYSSDKDIRSTSLSSGATTWTSDGSEHPEWPYLPQGNYILKGTASQNGVEVHLEEKSITVDDKPTFTVNTPSAHTSYNTYLSSGATAANNEDGSTIYGITNNGVKISNNILQNANYSQLIGGYTYFIDGNSANEGNNANQSWAAHDIVAKYTFDGVTAASAPLTRHVTGLPYTAAPPTNTGSHPWSGNAKSWEGSFVRLHAGTITQTFHVPNDIDLSVYHEARIYTRADDTIYTFYIGGNIAYTKKQSSTGGKETYDKTTYNIYKFTTSQNSIKCENTYGTVDAWLEYTNVKVYNITVKYR